MFTEIGIENFKAFGKMQRIPLKPITLLYGPNSSGKSSLMQSILLLKQTLEESGDDKIVLLPKGNLADLGGYQEFINGHVSRKEFHLSISFRYAWQEMEWYDWIWGEGMCADPTLDFSFFQEKTGEILLKSISVSESLHTDPIMTWKNVWAMPHLKRIILNRKEQFERDGNAKEDIDEWLFNIKRSVLIMDHINLAHYLIKHYWDGYDKTRYTNVNVKNSDGTRKRYAESIGYSHTQNDLKELKNSIKKKTEEIKSRNDKLATDYSELKPEEIEEEKERLAVSRAQLEQLKHILRISKKIHKSLINSSFDEFLKIKYFPASSRLISISNCFPHDEIDLCGDEELLFQNIPEFALLGKETKACEVYDQIAYATNVLPFTSSLLKEYLRRIVYIGPLRENMERVYSYSGNIPSNVGKSGKYTPDILMKKPDLVNKVNDWFERFKIDYKLDHYCPNVS